MILIGIDPGVRKAEPWSIKTGKYKKENRLVITCGCGVIFKRYRKTVGLWRIYSRFGVEITGQKEAG